MWILSNSGKPHSGGNPEPNLVLRLGRCRDLMVGIPLGWRESPDYKLA
jgi:hypothetical protein